MMWDILTENWFSLPQENGETTAEVTDRPGTPTSPKAEEPDESEPVSTQKEIIND